MTMAINITSYAASLVLWSLVHWTVVVDFAGTTSVHHTERPGDLRFPRDWRGRYFQSGLGEIIIRDNQITTKGKLIEHSRDYYLFDNRENNCYVCLLLLRRHKNIIQYKESYCMTGAGPRLTLKTICSQIQVESSLYTLVREPALPVPCPFQGAFQFTYNDLVSGTCDASVTSSYAKPCVGHSRYQLKFNHCVQSAAFHGHNVELECLATWKDGSETHLYGKLTSSHLKNKDERYRCFKHHQHGGEVSLAMSVDATCQGLRSSTDGPFLIKFNKDTLSWPSPKCQFPEWLKDITWRDLSGQSRFSIAHNGDTLSHYKLKTTPALTSTASDQWAITTEYQCLQNSKSSYDTDANVILSLTHNNCAVKRQCLKLQRLSNNAVKLYIGQWLKQDSSTSRCSTDIFSQGFILIANNATVDSCPRRGVYHTPVSNGCLQRVSVGCLNESTVAIDNSCASRLLGQTRFNCMTSWNQDDKKYLVLREQSSNATTRLRCLSFQQLGNVTSFGDDVTCNSDFNDVTNASVSTATAYSLSRHDNCRADVTSYRDVTTTKRRIASSTTTQSMNPYRSDVTLSGGNRSHAVVIPIRRPDDEDDDTEYTDDPQSSGDDINKVKGHYDIVTVATPNVSRTLSQSGLVIKTRSPGYVDHEVIPSKTSEASHCMSLCGKLLLFLLVVLTFRAR